MGVSTSFEGINKLLYATVYASTALSLPSGPPQGQRRGGRQKTNNKQHVANYRYLNQDVALDESEVRNAAWDRLSWRLRIKPASRFFIG